MQTGRTSGELPSSASFMSIEPQQLMFSTLKRAESGEKDHYVLRVYNPTEETISGTISTQFQIAEASLLTLEEKIISMLPLKDKNTVKIDVGPKKISTILFNLS